MRDLRTMNMSEGQKIESDEVMKRIGDLSFRNFGTLAKSSLIDKVKTIIIGDGLRVEPSAGMTVNVTSGSCIQSLSSIDALSCIQVSDQTVTMDAASGAPRTDIVEVQVQSVTDKDDLALTATVSSGSTVTITNETIKRDIKYYLQARKSTNTTTPTAATAGEYTSTVTIAGTIDLSTRSKINLVDGEDGSLTEIDCKGATPSATTIAEIISNINTGIGRAIATNSSNKVKLTGNGTGETSYFKLKPPQNTDEDATAIIFGLSIGGAYKYEYQGENEWFKIAEINLGAATTVITTAEILNLDEKPSWATGASDILLKRHLFQSETYDYVVEDQADFNALFIRNSAGNYSINPNYTSVFFKTGAYTISSLKTNFGDGATTTIVLNTNQCHLIQGNYAQIDYDSDDGQIRLDGFHSQYFNLRVVGDGSTPLSGGLATFYINNYHIVVQNCVVSGRIGTIDGFSGGASFVPFASLFNCYFANGAVGFKDLYNLYSCYSTIAGSHGFDNCENMTNCTSNSSVSGDGFKDSEFFNNCHAASNAGSGFNNCILINNCESTSNTFFGFYLCKYISTTCYSFGNPSGNYQTAYGIVADSTPSGSDAISGDPFFTKFLSGVVGGGVPAYTLSHSITNAYTNKRIVAHIVYRDDSVFPSMNCPVGIGGITIDPLTTAYDNTNILGSQGATGSITLYAYIVYR